MSASCDKQMKYFLSDEGETTRLGATFASVLSNGSIVFLYGNLGAGKTCFSRAVLQALGVNGRVKSPTFTLVEPYSIEDVGEVYHFDFYRLSDAEEALYLGVDDYIQTAFACFIEWPEKARGFLPKADICVHLDYKISGRDITLQAGSQKGRNMLALLSEQINKMS